MKTSREFPCKITDQAYRHTAFKNGEVLLHKKNGRLPAMGWNSWNAFGSQNTEELTKAMADAMIALELNQAGYEYLVLDDGCYKSERVNGRLANEPVKFPHDFSVLADYIHHKGLKFGMYNDIGTNLCAGSEVGTCGYEDVDAESYINWKIDFLKVDNCYYLWDNATFSNAENAKYTYAPNIKAITVSKDAFQKKQDAVENGLLTGQGAIKHIQGYVTNLGTFDGTNVGVTPIGEQSGELVFMTDVPETGEYALVVTYATGKEAGVGSWLQIAVGEGEQEVRYFDDLLPETPDKTTFQDTAPIMLHLQQGENRIRLMNHRRQENVLYSYAALLASLNEKKPEHDIVLSICEWGKTQPQNWGYKVGSSWRILNDICFQVGSPQQCGNASWEDAGTCSITSQYDKCVIMDEFAGLDKGWNDPDMMVIGLNGMTTVMNKTHMTMWCMMNAPLMLGLDLRTVKKGDEIWQIIANRQVIALNQDALGMQAKRIYCSLEKENPATAYITNHERVDILAKPLANGDVALAFINVSGHVMQGTYQVTVQDICEAIGHTMTNQQKFQQAKSYELVDVWSNVKTTQTAKLFCVEELAAYDSVTLRITPCM